MNGSGAMLLKDCQKLTAITSCYTAVHQPSQTHQGNLACKQAFLFGQGARGVKYDLGGDSGHLASLFSSRSIHEFGFLANVQFQKISVLPSKEGIGISWGMGGSGRSKNIKKCMKL